jgi:hypothetical protein
VDAVSRPRQNFVTPADLGRRVSFQLELPNGFIREVVGTLEDYDRAALFGTLGQIVVSIDRYAFGLSVFVGTAAWIYIDSRRIPPAFTPEYGTQLHRFFLLCLAATGALITSVISDGVLTSLRLVGTRWSLGSLIPVVSMAIEVVCAVRLVVSIRGMTQRAASTGRTARMG